MFDASPHAMSLRNSEGSRRVGYGWIYLIDCIYVLTMIACSWCREIAFPARRPQWPQASESHSRGQHAVRSTYTTKVRRMHASLPRELARCSHAGKGTRITLCRSRRQSRNQGPAISLSSSAHPSSLRARYRLCRRAASRLGRRCEDWQRRLPRTDYC